MAKQWRPVEPDDGSPAITLTKSEGVVVIKQGDNVITLKGMQHQYLFLSLAYADNYIPESLDNCPL